MIVDRKHNVLIVTPPKCATQTIVGMATRIDGVERTRSYHDAGPAPAGCEGMLRLQMARNPWARLVSVWSYVHNRYAGQRKGWDWVSGTSFAEFVNQWVETRATYVIDEKRWTMGEVMWWLTQGDYLDRWQPARLLRTEHLMDDLQSLGLDYGEERVLNKSSRQGGVEGWVPYYDRDSWQRVGESFAFADAVRLRYPTEPPDGLTGELSGVRLGRFAEADSGRPGRPNSDVVDSSSTGQQPQDPTKGSKTMTTKTEDKVVRNRFGVDIEFTTGQAKRVDGKAVATRESKPEGERGFVWTVKHKGVAAPVGPFEARRDAVLEMTKAEREAKEAEKEKAKEARAAARAEREVERAKAKEEREKAKAARAAEREKAKAEAEKAAAKS